MASKKSDSESTGTDEVKDENAGTTNEAQQAEAQKEEQKQEEVQESSPTAEDGWYKLEGMKTPGEHIDRLILEGSTSNPVRYIDINQHGKMTGAEVDRQRLDGVKLRKLDSEQSAKADEALAAQEKRAAENDGVLLPETRAEQQASQLPENAVASTTGNAGSN